MDVKYIFANAGLVATTVLMISNTAQAASFTTNVSQSADAKADIILQSITQKNSEGKEVKVSNFSLINQVKINYNSPRNNDPNSGAASTDKGDTATAPKLPNEAPDAVEIAAFMNNKNLNNIVDTEDVGQFNIDFFFDSEIRNDKSGLDSLFFWERGMNSNITIFALDKAGQVIGNNDGLKLYGISNPKDNTGSKLKLELDGLEKEVTSIQTSLKNFQTQETQLKTTVSSLEQEVITLREQHRTLNDKNTILTSEYNTLANDYTVLNNRVNDLKKKSKKTNAEIAELKEKEPLVAPKKQERDAKKLELDTNSGLLKNTKSALDTKDKSLTTNSEKLTGITKQIESQTETLQSKQNQPRLQELRMIVQADAKYSIDTLEIGGSQKVGSWGVNLAQLGVKSLSGVRIIANGSIDNGPDFKVMGRRVPESGNILALGLVAATAGVLRRRQAKQVIG